MHLIPVVSSLLPSASAACLVLCLAGCGGGEKWREGGQDGAEALEAAAVPSTSVLIYKTPDQRPPMKLYLWESGVAREVYPREACAHRIPVLLDELFAGASIPLRLLVTEEWIQEALAQGRWVEVRYDAITVFTSLARGDVALDRLLFPLEHPTLAPPPSTPQGPRPSSNVTLFSGEPEGGWITGPLANPEGWPLARELEACLTWERPG